MENNLLSESKKLGTMYFFVAAVLFGAQILFGLVAGTQFVYPGFLFETLDFNVARMVHINALVVWLLYAMIGSVYYLLPDETKIETVGIVFGKIGFYILTLAVTVVVLVYIIVQVGPADESTLWLIQEGREYIEAPRWADIGIVVVVLVFLANVYLTAMKGERTGIITVLMADLLALAGLYLAGMFYTDNISIDQYWWWWVIHLWVEATWEVFVAAIIGWALIKIIGANRQIVEMWLWIEVAMLFGSGILGIGHHYFWIGTPEYWWEIGALFSALEPVPLVAMFVHVMFDWGKEQGLQKASGMKPMMNNTPAFLWFVGSAFGNFIGAGVWGFFHTLPQMNIYTHGTQFTSAHGHLAFFGAFAMAMIAMFYMGVQGKSGKANLRMTFASKMGFVLICFGVVGMAVALTIAGYGQVMVERAQMGATWEGYFVSQNSHWFLQAMAWRLVMGVVTLVGFVYLVYDLLTIKNAKINNEI